MNESAPSINNDDEIQPVSVIKYQPEEKTYVLEPNKYDIGKYLNLLKVKPYQTITITLKEGNYSWDENFYMPEHTIIKLIGDKYKNGGNDNIVTITISKKNTNITDNLIKYLI